MLNSASEKFTYPNLGLGAQLRHSHIQQLLTQSAKVDWLEVNYTSIADHNGYARHLLGELSAEKPLVLVFNHNELYDSVLSKRFLDKLCKLTDVLQPIGLLFKGQDYGTFLSDETVQVATQNIKRLQSMTSIKVLIETPYVDMKQSPLHPANFVDVLVSETACGVCFNIDNVLASVELDRQLLATYIRALPIHNIAQIYFNAERATNAIGCDSDVLDCGLLTVDVYKAVQHLTGGVATLIERSEIPNAEHQPFSDLLNGIVLQSKRLDKQLAELSKSNVLDEIMAYAFKEKALA